MRQLIQNVVFALTLALSCNTSAQLPEPELPEGVEGYWIARSMEYNGVEMSMRGFHIKGQLKATQQLFDQMLAQLGDKSVSYSLDGWHFQGSGDDNWFYTVQLKPDLLGVEGILSVSELPGKSRHEAEPTTPEYPPGVMRVMQQHNNENGEHFDLEVLATHAGVEGSRDIAISMFTERGWELLQNQPQQLLFRRSQGRLRVFIQARDGYPGSLMLVTREGRHAR
ncbi:hypothetical protein [Amphritea balenae]|uniref:Uncharacterized protein n=1 Tax=Amphritea balenae TaxID=452629 RepID=A0A3P1SR09_9GAMM|nr:hypothetical protein [Amphritea balenae]RRC98602.1 hypothetical protein EHS89_13405 [Amphritea balenae]GGK65842.1 hypothetical protein GCM10007941_15080 [Amphritea balenae]